MTDIKPNFVNEERDLTSVAAIINGSTDLANEDLEQNVAETNPVDDKSRGDVSKYIVKAPRPDSKLILQNMEEVLNSVKKKHRQKHKRKREQKKLAQMEAVAVAVATAELEREEALGEDPASDEVNLNESATCHLRKSKDAAKTHGKRLKTQPLQEKSVQDNGQEARSRNGRKSKTSENKSPLKNSTGNGDILRHFQRTPKKNEEIADIAKDKDGINDTSPTTNQPTKPMNAFEVMMNARNKTIGSNTPGKETSPTASQESMVNTKRKLMLQEWADKKGATKRKLEEETRAAYVESQLENRAKRLKQMLGHATSPKEDDTPPSRTPKERKRDKKIANASNATKQIVQKPKRKKHTALRLQSVDSNTDTEEIVTVDPETEEFLAKLNSPTKKRDSLLGYFPRKDSPTENALLAKSKNHTENETPKSTKSKSKGQTKSETSKAENATNQDSKALSTKSKEIKNTDTLKTRAPRRSTKNSIEVTAVETDTPKIENIAQAPQDEEKQQGTAEAEQTPSGRPKRSCAGKARYDYDLEVSPTKLEATKQVVHKTNKKRETASVDVDEIIQLDDSNLSLSPEKVPKKLAPVFVRAMPKPSPDPVALKARQDFLMSGVPEKMRLEMEKQKQYEQTYDEDLDYFPRVCHVQQLNADEQVFLQSKQDFNTKLKPCEYELAFEITNDSTNLLKAKGSRRKSRSNMTAGNTPKAKAKENVNQCSQNKTQWQSTHQLPTIENKRTIIKSWKTEYERFPTFKCYNQMREKYRFFSALDAAQDMEQVSESFVVTRRTQRTRNTETINAANEQDDVKPPATAPNGELLFTEKYKPMLVEQVLVNLVPVTQLRDFLAVWANGSNASSARNSQTIDDSFDGSNDSNSSLCNVTGNAVVLLGPVSSGKTNAVYALANDMNFNVLEINAGMKRTGKRLIQELQEATQSHQIRKDSTPTQSASKAQKNLLRMSLNGKKLKQQNSQNHMDADTSNNSNADTSQNTRKCLILIEDADVVFDQLDCGFTDAIYTLAASSKRPVIVMATNPNCPHLQRLMNQNTIYFTPPNALNISRFMSVLSLIENCPINLDDLVSLYLFNRKDLRRTLLELQFFIQSGGDRHKLTSETNNPSETEQRTPQKGDRTKRELVYYASPAKCSITNEQTNIHQSQEPDEKLGRDRVNINGNDNKKSCNSNIYIHRSLFEFFTGNQNEKCRIPYPVDFGLLRVNLADVFQCSQRLHDVQPVKDANEPQAKHADDENSATTNGSLKRRTRTPKKTWLNDSTSANNVEQHAIAKPPLDVLCDFYDNISIAALLGTHNADMSEGNANTFSASGILGGGADLGIDRLLPNLSEHIAHELVEQAISVDLAAKACPYNLFNTPEERPSLCDYMNSNNTISSRSQRTRALDVEPALRAICRSEKQRAMQERRSTRFYHYLRHSASNFTSFSTEPFDEACSVLQEKNDATDVECEDDGKSKLKVED